MVSLKKYLAEELPKLYHKKPDHAVLSKVIDLVIQGINQLGDSYLKVKIL